MAHAITAESWTSALRSSGATYDQAVRALHEVLLGAAHFEVARHVTPVGRAELDDIAMQAADDALAKVLAKLDDFRGQSRFTTWAYKFALLEATVRLRRRAWSDRDVTLDSDSWTRLAANADGPDLNAERTELLRALTSCIASELTTHQRRVLVPLAIDGVPIDVLAERLGTSRGALYKTLHDARGRLRAALTDRGFDLATST